MSSDTTTSTTNTGITKNTTKRVDIDKPRYDQSTFSGRAKHFFATTNPLNCLASDSELEHAKNVVDAYRRGEEVNLSEDELWKLKELYDSAFHPQTGEKLFLLGRMSFQVPGNMTITGCMMTFYRSTPAVIFWQWANQSFNAIVNFTNRNASVGVSTEQLWISYGLATSTSVLTALLFNKIVSSTPALANGIIGRFVPLVAVAAANCVNIPFMRSEELKKGITIESADGTPLGSSQQAAIQAVSQVVPSRILMASPAMFIPPLIMAKLDKTAFLTKNPRLRAPVTILMTGVCLTVSTPLCCALFPQMASISVDQIEPELKQVAATKFPGEKTFYYNKGL